MRSFHGASSPNLHAEPIAQQLEATRSLVEGRFAQAGALLETALDVVGRLIESLERLTAAIDLETVGQTRRDLLSAAAQLSELPSARPDGQQGLARLKSPVEALRLHIDDMRQAMRYLRVFALNVKVAAAATHRSAAEFAGFADEMFNRIAAGMTELEEFGKSLDTLDAQLGSAIESQCDLDRQCSLLLPAVPDSLVANAEAVSGHHETMADLAVKVSALARNVQLKVASALSALQIGDITRQRIEHVQSSLAMLQAETGSAADPDSADRTARRVLHMLADQMADISEDFRRETDRMTRSLSGVASDTSEILGLQKLAASGQAGGGGLRGLEASVGQATALVGEVRSAVETADRIGQSTASTVDRLLQRVGIVQTVKNDVQRMAINTSLRCIRLGEVGKPLNVIAHELEFYAAHLEATATLTLDTLETLGVAAGDLASQRQGERVDGGLTGVSDRLDSAIDRLRHAAEAVEKDLSALTGQGKRVADTLGDTQWGADMQGDLSDVLHHVAEALAQMAGRPVDSADWTPESDELMERIAALYTMARERTVHAQYMPAGDAAEMTPAPAGGDEFLLEDVLF